MKLFSIITLVSILVFSSCKKEEVTPPPEPGEVIQEFSYDSLYFEGSVHLNDVVDLLTIASGKDLTYSWTIDIGTLLGSGEMVQFSACCTGFHDITCTVEDAYGNSEMRAINVKVLP